MEEARGNNFGAKSLQNQTKQIPRIIVILNQQHGTPDSGPFRKPLHSFAFDLAGQRFPSAAVGLALPRGCRNRDACLNPVAASSSYHRLRLGL